MSIGYLRGVEGPRDRLKRLEEEKTGIDERERRRRRRDKVLKGEGHVEALDIRFDPARTGPSELDARLTELARTCTSRDVQWWYPWGIETRVDFGEGRALAARPLAREFGPDAEGTVRFDLSGKGELRVKILPAEGIEVSQPEFEVSAGRSADLSLKLTGKTERFLRVDVEVRGGAASEPVRFPLFLIVGEKTRAEAKGAFELHPSETDPHWSLFGK